MGIRRRLDALEKRFKNKEPAPVVYSGAALEVREIDAEIKKLTVDIEEVEASMTPEELARRRAELEKFDASLDGLSLDEQIEALKDEITRRETDNEVGGGRLIQDLLPPGAHIQEPRLAGRRSRCSCTRPLEEWR